MSTRFLSSSLGRERKPNWKSNEFVDDAQIFTFPSLQPAAAMACLEQ